MSYEVWKTLFTKDFDCKKYIYHYTNLDNALKIILSNKLYFSDLNAKNDFPEEKVGIIHKDLTGNDNEINNKIKHIENFLQKRSSLIQLLCFCKDENIKQKVIEEISLNIENFDTNKYFNVMGRGFANPFMWSKYIKGNDGVCLVINMRKFEQILKTDVNFFVSQPVKYLPLNYNYIINSSNSLSEDIYRIKKQKKSITNLMRNDKSYIEYNFFHKRNDWKKENEYRYITFKEKKDNKLYVGDVDKYLEGIVLNKSTEIQNEQILELSQNNKYPIQRITFTNGHCYLL